MKKLLATAAVLAVSASAAFAAPTLGTNGLHVLANTGWADTYAAEGFGKAYDKTGGMPGMFTYDVDSSMLVEARKLLGDNEFLAPHFLKGWDGSVTIMVAPHTLVDGMVVHGGNVNKDHFIVVKDGMAERFSFSVLYGDNDGSMVSADLAKMQDDARNSQNTPFSVDDLNRFIKEAMEDGNDNRVEQLLVELEKVTK